MYRVVIVDDASDLRFLVKTQLKVSAEFSVVGEGADGHDAIALAERLQPDVVLLDVSMPGMDGLEALPRIRSIAPNTCVVMYTGFDEEGLATRVGELGATALLEKSTALDALVPQLLEAIEGSARVPEPVDQDALPQPSDDEAQLLGEHLERFREVFDEAAIGMATMTLTGRIVRANKALGELTGRDARELVTMSYAGLATDGRSVGQAVVDAREHPVRIEHLMQVPNGPRRLVLTTAAPVKDSRGRALYLFLQAQDITGQRTAEEALRQIEERFSLLVNAVQDYAIFMLDPTGHIASWNGGAARIKGYSAEDIVGRHFRVFYPEEKQLERHPEHELDLALRDGSYEEEGWRIRKDGTRFWASVVITAVHDADGRHIGFAKVTRDMTERRQMQLDREQYAAALAASNAELEAANTRLAREAADQAQFLAVTAHELRTPAAVLTGSAQLLQRHGGKMSDEERGEVHDAIATSGERLQRLVADLLTVSRLESKAIRINPTTVDVSAVLSHAAASARASSPEAEVAVECPPGLFVRADRDRLAQALDNLIANGLRHGKGPVRVDARDRGDMVEIRVRDGGPGVTQAMRSRLFERFASGGPGHGGTGLGLFIVRELARAQGGDAWYQPGPETGATFVVAVPREHATLE